MKRFDNATLLLDKVNQQLNKKGKPTHKKPVKVKVGGDDDDGNTRLIMSSREKAAEETTAGELIIENDDDGDDDKDKLVVGKLPAPLLQSEDDDEVEEIRAYLHKLRKTKSIEDNQNDYLLDSNIAHSKITPSKKLHAMPALDTETLKPGSSVSGKARTSKTLGKVVLLQSKYETRKKQLQLSPSSSEISITENNHTTVSEQNLGEKIILASSEIDPSSLSTHSALENILSIHDLITDSGKAEEVLDVKINDEALTLSERDNVQESYSRTESALSVRSLQEEEEQPTPTSTSVSDHSQSLPLLRNVRLDLSLTDDDDDIDQVAEKIIDENTKDEILENELVSDKQNESWPSFKDTEKAAIEVKSKDELVSRHEIVTFQGEENKPNTENKSRSCRNVGVQVDINRAPKDSEFLPAPVPSYVIEALSREVNPPAFRPRITELLLSQGLIQVVSNCGPGVLADTEMMRNQLFLTRQLYEEQRRSYLSQTSFLVPDKHYVTYEETANFLKAHRKHRKRSSKKLK